MSSKKHATDVASRLVSTYRAPIDLNDQSICDYFSALDCPRSLACWMLYAYGEHEQLLELKVDPTNYRTIHDFKMSFFATSFLSKADFLKVSFNRQEVAYTKFAQYEQLCAETNRRFLNPVVEQANHLSNDALLSVMRRKIYRILGDFDPEEWFAESDWGPGVTTFLKGSHVSAVNKFHSENGITRDLYALIGDLFPIAYPNWFRHLQSQETPFKFVVGNTLCTVPKNSKTDRVIAVEPGMNLWFQKGLGAMIRSRLRKVGIDLNDQRHNQRLALLASKTGKLATVDFSSASDSIATELVREILPPVWFSVLDASRSKLGASEDGVRRWSKFSSMGNGFTFELESLIFFAAASAVAEVYGSDQPISVYGDDVILDAAIFPPFDSFCKFLGFKINAEKSFYSPDVLFRESCGSYYWSGSDCKPIFLKERLSHVKSIYKLANSYRLLAHRSGYYHYCDRRWIHCYYRLVQGVPRALQLKVPFGLGDTGFVSNFDEACPSTARFGWEGFYTSAAIDVAVNAPFEGAGLLIERSRRSSLQAYGNYYTLRGRTKARVKRVLVSQWYNLGEWM